MADDLEARVQVLEEQLAHRDQDFQDLSDMVTQQWTKIEELKRELSQTKDRIITLEDEVGEGPAADQKPPHW
ncbi:SlyX family protein [Magnetovibrio sp. PR-2]|uniref:SlyX family protein n=1 Tax=Magnetovibrio sp. PR-2 TaxID=3120356 RepID=UPI002FCE181C